MAPNQIIGGAMAPLPPPYRAPMLGSPKYGLKKLYADFCRVSWINNELF